MCMYAVCTPLHCIRIKVSHMLTYRNSSPLRVNRNGTHNSQEMEWKKWARTSKSTNEEDEEEEEGKEEEKQWRKWIRKRQRDRKRVRDGAKRKIRDGKWCLRMERCKIPFIYTNIRTLRIYMETYNIDECVHVHKHISLSSMMCFHSGTTNFETHHQRPKRWSKCDLRVC